MSTLNLLKPHLTAESLARFFGLMLIAWQPFWSGARLPTLLLVLLGLWMLWHKRIDFSSTPVKRLGMVFLLLGVPVLISIPGSYDIQGSLSVAAVLLLFYIAGLALLQGLKRSEDQQWLQKWLLIVLLAWTMDGWIQYLFGRDLLGVPFGEDGRILGPFGGNLHLGIFLTVLMPATLWHLAKERPWVALVILALIAFIAGMSGARSNVVFLLLGSALLFTQFAWRQRLLMAPILAGMLALTVALSPTLPAKISQFSSFTTNTGLFQKIDNALSLRLTIWETGWHMLQDRPFTGVGTSAFAEAYDTYSPRTDDPFRNGGPMKTPYHAHQMYVSIAAESGWPGLIGLMVAIGLCASWFFRAPQAYRHQAAPYAASLAVIVFPIQSQPVLYTIWWFPIVLLLLCSMITSLSLPTPAEKPKQ
ncbi:O-antigen ligase [Sulfuritortus calidifontis]|uniref:O-antigen ligase n=1 Tax=Sulfuritortus calidifontis TaxID=1914471 RepID=A0A4V2UQL1_9PROT|nr:O-antigen ligase family protein [Sulfuritortus calidifontis]TCS71307.1 O-antigen ligase [Sulfuritortus calidifontis]